jgi:type 1 glutamine amidotransferase
MEIITKTGRKNGFTFTATFQNKYGGKFVAICQYGKHIVYSSSGHSSDKYTEDDMRQIIREMKNDFFRYQDGAVEFPKALKRGPK